MAVIKHFIGNEQEMWREYNPIQPAYTANIGQYTSALTLDEKTDKKSQQMIGQCTSYTCGRLQKVSMRESPQSWPPTTL